MRVTCETDYIVAGNNPRKCQNAGWKDDAPTCTKSGGFLNSSWASFRIVHLYFLEGRTTLMGSLSGWDLLVVKVLECY